MYYFGNVIGERGNTVVLERDRNNKSATTLLLEFNTVLLFAAKGAITSIILVFGIPAQNKSH